jgi:hypothetical protein
MGATTSTTKGRFGPGDGSHVVSHPHQAWQLLNATQPCDDCLVIKQTKAILAKQSSGLDTFPVVVRELNLNLGS